MPRYNYKQKEIEKWEENKLFDEFKWKDQDEIIEYIESLRSDKDPDKRKEFERKNDPLKNTPTFEHKLYILWRRIYQKKMQGENS
jgi:hypothetical protein